MRRKAMYIEHRRGERGITLPEILIVVAFLGLFAIVTIPSFRNTMRAFSVKSSAMQVRDVTRLGRQMAVSRNDQCVGDLDLDEGSYNVWVDDDSDNAKDAGEDTVRPIPSIDPQVQIVQVDSNTAWSSNAGQVLFQMKADGSVARVGQAVTETEWCVHMKRQIHSQRLEHWIVQFKANGKTALVNGKDSPNPCNHI
jgi:Tfp pilus assembly protein FimT